MVDTRKIIHKWMKANPQDTHRKSTGQQEEKRRIFSRLSDQTKETLFKEDLRYRMQGQRSLMNESMEEFKKRVIQAQIQNADKDLIFPHVRPWEWVVLAFYFCLCVFFCFRSYLRLGLSPDAGVFILLFPVMIFSFAYIVVHLLVLFFLFVLKLFNVKCVKDEGHFYTRSFILTYKILISILTFSYLSKAFSLFKGKGGSFGGGGASGRW